MKALQIDRKLARFAAARILSSFAPGAGGAHGPLELVDVDPPVLPAAGWHRLRPRLSGICGSDLATIDGAASRYFEPIVSFPFTPGHEVVADTDDGRRVVVIPVLTCVTRGLPPCPMCAADRINLCENIAFGHLSPGLQTGFCKDTGGGWSHEMVAHESQLVDVPGELTDEQAVMVEPTACAVHAASRCAGELTVIIGAGTLGLLTLAAIQARRDGDPSRPPLITARYPHQIAAARALGGKAVATAELARTVRSIGGGMVAGDQLTRGADLVVDCVGSNDSLAQALQVVAPGGTILLVGMPATVKLDMTTLWHREVSIRGCYAYERDDFETALDLVGRFDLGRFVTQTYPLRDHADAIEHAANAGRRGAVKIAFDLRSERGR